MAIDPHHERIGSLALALGRAGRRDQAVDMLQRPTDLASRSYVSPFSFAEAHAGLRQTEPWRQAMAAALEERAGLLVALDAEWWDSMRDDRIWRSCGEGRTACAPVTTELPGDVTLTLVRSLRPGSGAAFGTTWCSPVCVRASDATNCDRTVIRRFR